MGFFDELKKSIFGESASQPPILQQSRSSNSRFQSQPGPCDVVLTDEGGNKIACIKAIRRICPDLGLAAAKELCESTPQLLLNDVSKKTAQKALAILSEAGAKGTVETNKSGSTQQPLPSLPKPERKLEQPKPKKKTYQPPSSDKTIVIEYLNYAGELKQFIGDPKSIVRKGNHFSIRVAPSFKRISLNRSKTRILKGVPAPAQLPTEPLPVQTTTSDTSIIQYTNFESVKKDFTIITGVIDDKGDYVRVRVSPTFKYITLKRTRIGNPEALFESNNTGTDSKPTTEPKTPDIPSEPQAVVAEVAPQPSGTVNVVITGCSLATYDATKIVREIRPDLSTFEIYNLLRDFPQFVAENVEPDKAASYKKQLEDAGCTVELT
jgi:large subunit ribosomal protein L7/L12